MKAKGRPRLSEGEKMIHTTVTLPPDDIAFLDVVGGGNISRGIRAVLRDIELREEWISEGGADEYKPEPD